MRTASFRRVTKHRAAFTLIEILVVIVVISILASLVAPEIFKHVGSAREATAKSQIDMMGSALDAFRLDNGRYPTSDEGLAALWEQPQSGLTNWRGPYLRKKIPLDPWGNTYGYASPGEVNPTTYDLQSYGADGQAGGEDENADIVSW